MNDTEIIDDLREKITNLIKEHDTKHFFRFIKENDVILKDLNSSKFDILIFSIDHDASIPIIKFILEQIQYESLNYSIINEHYSFNKTPLYSAILKNNFKVADLLLENNADINFLQLKDLYFFNQSFLLNHRNLNYILSHGLKKENLFSKFFYDLLRNRQISYLNLIFNHFCFNNEMILSLLQTYKNQIPISNEKLKDIITKEKNRIKIDRVMYGYAVRSENYNSLKILLENDGNGDTEIYNFIKEFGMLEKAVKTSNYSLVKTIFDCELRIYKEKFSKNNHKTINAHFPINIIELFIKSLFNLNNDQVKKLNIPTVNSYSNEFLNLFLGYAIKFKNLPFIEILTKTHHLKFHCFEKNIYGEYPYLFFFSSTTMDILEYLYNDENISDLKTNNQKILSESIQYKNHRILSFLLNHSIDITIKDNINGEYPLINAIDKTDKTSVELLVNYIKKNNITFSFVDKNGNKPLIHYYKSKVNNIFKSLYQFCDEKDSFFEFLLKTLNIYEKDSEGHSLLFYSIRDNDKTTTKYLIKHNVNVHSIDNSLSYSALDWAIGLGKKEIIDTILSCCSKKTNKKLLTKINSDGFTPLISLVRSSNFKAKYKIKIIPKLIKNGADIYFCDDDGKNAYDHAVYCNNIPIINFLAKNYRFVPEEDPINDSLIDAIESVDVNRVKELVQHAKNNKIKITEQDNDGDTPLIASYLYYRNSPNVYGNIYHYLLKNLNVNQRNSKKRTILYYAIDEQDIKTTKYLMNNGADVCSINEFNDSALDFAIDKGNVELILTVINNCRKKVLDRLNSIDETPMISIVKKDDMYSLKTQKKLIRQLIKKGADVNCSIDDKTALDYAYEYDNVKLANYLILQGAFE